MKKIVLTFGLISGGILSAMLALTLPFMDRIGFDHGMILGYTTMVVAFLLIYFGVRSYRDNVGNGSIRFGRAFTVGALIAFIASACYVATWQVIYFNFAGDFTEKYQAYTLEKERAAGATEEQLARRKAELDDFAVRYRNPYYNAALTFLEPLPVGLLIALVSAGALSRRRRAPAHAGDAGDAGDAVVAT